MPEQLYTIKEVARATQFSEKTIRRAIDARQLACTRIGAGIRISESQYRDRIRRNTQSVVL